MKICFDRGYNDMSCHSNETTPLPNTAVAVIFPHLCLRSNLGGIYSEKRHRATLINDDGNGSKNFTQKRKFDYLDTDLKQIACVSPSCIIYSSRLNNFKHKLFILFLKFASNVSHLEELMCYDCRFSLYCNCIRR